MSIRECIGSTFYIILLNAHRRAGGQYFSSSQKPTETACDPRTLWQNTYQQLRAAGRKPPAHQRVYRQRISRPRGILSLYRCAPFSMTGTQPFPEKPPAVSTQAASLLPAGSLPIDFRGGPFTHSTAGMLRGIKSGLE